MLKAVGSVLILLALVFVGYSYHVSRPVVEGTRGSYAPLVADPAEALTFARSAEGLIWVTRHVGDAVRGINLTAIFGSEATADLISFVSTLDPSALPNPGAGGDSSTVQRFAVKDLQMPLQYRYPSIAAGTNFKEHAQEIYSDDPPFLFPKLTEPGPWNTPVDFVPRLDYEAELCMFPLADINTPDKLPAFGLVLCNDFTDRWTLVKEIDLGQPLGLTGFASGKGCNRCLPTGYLVVIPRSPDFYLRLELALFVNDTLRQEFRMSDLILPIEEIIKQAFEMQDSNYWQGEETVRLMPHGNIPRGSLILTGTAAGVLFKPLNIWNQGFYLQAGDVVRTEATFLGHLENTIQEE